MLRKPRRMFNNPQEKNPGGKNPSRVTRVRNSSARHEASPSKYGSYGTAQLSPPIVGLCNAHTQREPDRTCRTGSVCLSHTFCFSYFLRC